MAPLTFKDTMLCDLFRETPARDGRYINYGEIEEVNITWKKIYSEKGDIDLSGQVFVTSPYKAQVNEINARLQQIGGFLHNKTIRYRENLLVSTGDSLQGKERQVVILSHTRSKKTSHVGFLRDPRRLNVATSRSRHLLFLIGDSSMVYGSNMIRSLWDAVISNKSGTNLIKLRPEHHDRDPEERSRYQRAAQNALRRTQNFSVLWNRLNESSSNCFPNFHCKD